MKTIRRNLNKTTKDFIIFCNKAGFKKSITRPEIVEVIEKENLLFPQYITSKTYGAISFERSTFVLPDIDGYMDVPNSFDENTYSYLYGKPTVKRVKKCSAKKAKVVKSSDMVDEYEKKKRAPKQSVNDIKDEPKFNCLPDLIKSRKGKFYAYHRAMGTHSRMVNFIAEFLEYTKNYSKDIMKQVEKINENDWTISIACRCWMKLKDVGYEKTAEGISTYNYIRKALPKLLNPKLNNATPDIKKQKKSVYDHLLEKVDKVTAYIDGVVDTFVTDTTVTFDVREFLFRENIAGKVANMIKANLEKSYGDFMLLAKDEELKEAYNLDNKTAKRYEKFLGKILADIDLYIGGSKAQASKRVKSKTKTKLKVQYKISDEEYGISSVAPEKILGKSKVWLFNTKSRELSYVETTHEDGITIRGTSIIDVDETKSFAIRLRKPLGLINAILAKKQKEIKSELNSIKTKKNKATGRINRYTIILGV